MDALAKKPPTDKSSLDAYRGKRDPAATNEPFGAEPLHSSAATRRGAFVIHCHAARNLHYDLRLEVGGALTSFAVPKGPSLDPKEKRLAIQTEDHPIAYLDFEDVIPRGNYGAGAMIVWDQGRVHYPEAPAEEGIRDGKVDFILDGFKVGGRFALVRTNPRGAGPKPQRSDGKPFEWLLLKKVDGFSKPGSDIIAESPRSVLSGLTVEERADSLDVGEAVRAEAERLGAKPSTGKEGRRISPMLCSLEEPELEAEGWIYELKLDGVRILADKRGDDVKLSYRTGRPATASYPEIANAVRTLPVERALLDGEIVAFDETGKPNFQRLGQRIHARKHGDVSFVVTAVPVRYLVFDLLHIGDQDLTPLPLSARKALLEEVVRGQGFVRALDHIEDSGQALYDFCLEQGLEGVVAKRAASKYMEGPTRYPDWVKIKTEREADFVVVGYTKGEGGRKELGALDLASFDENGILMIRGKAGSGLAEATIATLLPRLEKLKRSKPQAAGTYGSKKAGRVHVKPELVVNVRYLGWSEDGALRFPVFRGLREDMAMEDCTEAPRLADDAAEALSDAPRDTKSDSRVAGRHRVPLTNQNKVFWPDEGFTKGDLCEYYEAIAPTLLPYLEDRPVMLVRYPDGIRGKSFYQWRVPWRAPSWIRSLPIKSEEDDKDVTCFLVEDLDTLLYIANLGCIPVHILGGRKGRLDLADFVTIDFDLGDRPLRDAVTLARALRDLTEEIGLPSFPKTSGQTGLHVFIPVGEGVGWPTAKMLGEVLGRILVAQHQDIATMMRSKERRVGKVYIDVGQIGASRTIVAPYSVRAHPGATVSTPLTWDEVGFALDPRALSIQTVPARVAKTGDPMAGLLAAEVDVGAAIEALSPHIGG